VERLREAIEELEAQAGLDPSELSSLIDRLQALLCRTLHEGRKRGDHFLEGQTPCSWAASICRLSAPAAAEKLRVGAEMENLPVVAGALCAGEIGYQATALICKLSAALGEKRDRMEEAEWIGYAQKFPVDTLRRLTEHARYVADPDGADRADEEDYEQRYLHLSPLGRMYKLDALLDHEGGLTLRAAIESLAHRLGEEDYRSPKQRRADAFVEMVHHALEKGALPRRHGVRPHIALHTTPEGLRRELGAPAAELSDGTPISNKAVQRLACDGLMHRVLKADSMVIDVGRAHRTAQPAQWRALKARHQTCAAPGCDRPINWTQAHHVDFWEHGGRSDVHRMLPLCYFHHRLVHEGDWQVVMAGERVEFIPPDRPVMIRRRWGERRWAA